MFPLKANDPYIKETGERSTLGSVVGGGGSDTPELPDYSIADAGKVLKVGDDGSLEWDDAGAGGGDEVILDYIESFAQSSGSHSYTNVITISEAGKYKLFVGGFLNSATVKINDVTQSNSFNDGVYVHYYYESEKMLSAGDIINISLESSGKTMFNAIIVKLGSEE